MEGLSSLVSKEEMRATFIIIKSCNLSYQELLSGADLRSCVQLMFCSVVLQCFEQRMT